MPLSRICVNRCNLRHLRFLATLRTSKKSDVRNKTMISRCAMSFLLAAALVASAAAAGVAHGQTSGPPGALALRPPTRADILRGEYGRYRANNDLLFYHLD